ncbi:methyltransferase type 11 [Setomelanomma holmii]|uniref:Methyltransferase type 11 n=1 Tax=Setomelanomma holmii TaxID=210430 RepID=A0A9P4LSA9_9PLEO|nr:methyltransferase type 11 [Setomelanomma holmii]
MATQTRFSGLIGPLRLIWLSIKFHYIALKSGLHTDGLTTLLHPRRLHDVAVANMFIQTSPGFIAYENTTNVQDLVSSAAGTIIELGPGPGNQLQRFNPLLVDKIYGIEPSPHYAANLALKAKKVDLGGKYQVLSCGIEDASALSRARIMDESVDTILSIQVLCSVADINLVLGTVYKLLKPGGRFVFWEHVRSRDTVTAVAQACWNPTWHTLVGCQLGLDIKSGILAAGEWENAEEILVEDDGVSCLPRISGSLVKKR